jgi:hypothetical protein
MNNLNVLIVAITMLINSGLLRRKLKNFDRLPANQSLMMRKTTDIELTAQRKNSLQWFTTMVNTKFHTKGTSAPTINTSDNQSFKLVRKAGEDAKKTLSLFH